MSAITSTPAVVQVPKLIGAKPTPQKPKTQAEKKANFAETLARTDAYVSSSSQLVQNAALSLFNSYQNTAAAMASVNSGRVVTDYTNVLGSVKRAAVQRTVTSVVGNGWQVVRGKISLAEAGGRVVGDVGTSAVSDAAGAIATNVAVWGLAKAGASSLPVMVGGMVAGWAANNITHRVLGKTGATQAVVNKTTEALQSLGSQNSQN